ncbi:transposase [Pseudonocardia sp. ICBG601]|uniref:transposase n=1 Tax=Pseudonocardia sp. ICBG601 TaxID=2846759 RepID=UPI0035AB8DE9
MVIEPLFTAARAAGRPVCSCSSRDVLDAILYVVRTGCAWRRCRWTSRPGRPSTGTSTSGNSRRSPRRSSRSCGGSYVSPRAVIRTECGDHRFPVVKGADTVGQDSRGYDAG